MTNPMEVRQASHLGSDSGLHLRCAEALAREAGTLQWNYQWHENGKVF